VRFDTTRWSLVLAARGDDSAEARRALESLCEAYWYPLYAFVRRRGETPDDARDLTQAFFASLLARRSFDDLAPERGRFRAFLVAALKHFLANQGARARAQKRGGGLSFGPLIPGADVAEGHYQQEPADPTTPETLFERRWALTVIERVLEELRGRWASDGREREFEALKECLLGQSPRGGYSAVADDLGMTPGAVKAAVHRLRRRFHDGLHRHIAETVDDPAEIEDEIRYLIAVLGRL